jgi:dipeptidyl-peptidase-4
VYDIATKAISQITNDGKRKRHYKQITDWFTKKNLLVRAFDWSADGKK